jgi:hypothetical protein
MQMKAIMIWPEAQPMARTMGVDARDVSFITYDSVNSEAL